MASCTSWRTALMGAKASNLARAERRARPTPKQMSPSERIPQRPAQATNIRTVIEATDGGLKVDPNFVDGEYFPDLKHRGVMIASATS